ncbi:MAG: enoyl-CoA hydratase/isomerase family protein, partial [Alphaproteobacteria bacterium]|nr:enoyl-CoA hydratase/isomerase family protein [Alphaproteobacteria bacterium]
YPKPVVALIDGVTMGGGVGISVHGPFRIATERTVFAMPETGIGLFPDVGGTYFLPRCPGETGMYLALTGARLDVTDARYAGIATHVVPHAQHASLLDALCNSADPLEKVLAGHAVLAQDKPRLEGLRPAIDSHFAGSSLEAIFASLAAGKTLFEEQALKTLQTKSPTSLKVAFRQVREGAKLGFEDCMRLEFRLTNRFMRGSDFYEGVRAVIIDKDNTPRWNPPAIGEVDTADVDRYFAPLEGGDLELG